MTLNTPVMVVSSTRRGVAVFRESPFLKVTLANTNQGKQRRTHAVNHHAMVVEVASGADVAPVGFWHSQDVDKTQFVKLYINGVKALTGLTSAGTKVFEDLYIKVQATIGTDLIYLSYNKLDPLIEAMSNSTYTRGMKELLDKGFIAASVDQGLYYINPDYMWNGNRLSFIKEYRLVQEAIHATNVTTLLKNVV